MTVQAPLSKTTLVNNSNAIPLHLPHWTSIADVNYSAEDKEESIALFSNKIPNVVDSQIVEGVIISISKREVLVDFGYKSDAVILCREFVDRKNFEVGALVELYIETREDASGRVIVSRKKAILVRTWEKIKNSLTHRTIIEGVVLNSTRGGLIIDINGIIGFLPETQIAAKANLELDSYIGKAIDVIVLKINNANNNVVLSHKAIVEQGLEQQRESILEGIEKGAVLRGIVKNLPNFGAFVDLGGVVGLLHITDIKWGRISHPADVLEVGQEINVVVLDFDKEQQRISLGMKQLSPHPWDSLPEDFLVGSKVKGVVVCIKDYGIFVEIIPGLEGLVHTTEMGWSFAQDSHNKLYSVGDEVEAVILELNREIFKLGLSIKKLSVDPWKNPDLSGRYVVGSKHVGRVNNITKFGVFVELEAGVDGLLHNSDLSWTERIDNASKLFQKGDSIEVLILSIDIDAQKLSLGYKHLFTNPYDTFRDLLQVGSIVSGILTKFTKASRGGIIKLECGIEAFSKKEALKKESGVEVQIGERINFKVLSYIAETFSLIVSHKATYDDSDVEFLSEQKKYSSDVVSAPEKEVYNPISGLSELKDKFSKSTDSIKSKS